MASNRSTRTAAVQAGRLTRTLCSVATTRHPRHSSTRSVANSSATLAAKAFLPGRASRTSKQSSVCPGRESSNIGEIQILRDQKAPTACAACQTSLSSRPAKCSEGTVSTVVPKCLEFGDQAFGQILVKLDVHRMGNSARISAVVAPSAKLASTVLKVTHVPLSTGSPPTMWGSRSMCSR